MNTLKQDEDKEAKEKSCLNMIQQNCYRLLRLVNNLIDITKIDAEFFELNLKNCNIVDLVEKITLSVSKYVESKGIILEFDTNTEEKYLACDLDQMERIVLNLLSNAVKFTPAGGRICVKVVDLGNRIVISVKDNGIGIPKEKQKHIFNRFQQVNKSLTRQFEGSGIGLSLVKSLVEKHGGKVSLKSKVGKGSEFILEFPCKVLDERECNWGSLDRLNHKQIERAKVEFSDIYSFGM
ncbi:MAG: HAMP domain-containing histidine kinase [Clostridiaceae bacterium]|nr:HAMP domain-containing histidine kinase [Clostridiaceae bacterium]